jgi:hypothetical protein
VAARAPAPGAALPLTHTPSKTTKQTTTVGLVTICTRGGRVPSNSNLHINQKCKQPVDSSISNGLELILSILATRLL